MRTFILFCTFAFTAAVPNGYHYAGQPGVQYSTAPVAAKAVDSLLHHNPQPLVTKNFFIHSAPEEEETEIEHQDIVIGVPRKKYNIVFVKSPATKQQKTKIRVIPAIQEDRTAIYVLTRNTAKPQVETYVEEPHITMTKPEVFFIKYKTNAEAEHAQHSIRDSFEQLGGSSSISNQGISPVSSFIGSLDNLRHQGKSIFNTNYAYGAYLPAVIRY
ncbi:uncharacterized protein LOC133321662 [Musca vetustissima]|uniref:uncharacterized protein LOC133321662 n=1 Tax=Musca vetustissima TaxID=27455 RepID=UPI002AB68A80|nr:uncharacterized protein LOC133321662 [Musca vetustissima]